MKKYLLQVMLVVILSRVTQNGESFVTFSLAVTTGPKDNQKLTG